MKRAATRPGSKRIRFPIYLWPEPEGGYTVLVPGLPGCITFGRDVEHARRMAEDAIRLYLADVRSDRRLESLSREGLLTAVEVAV